MAQTLEVIHLRLLRKLTKLKGERLRESLWRKVEAKTLLPGVGNQPLQTYLYRGQAIVVEWVDLRQTFDVCTK